MRVLVLLVLPCRFLARARYSPTITAALGTLPRQRYFADHSSYESFQYSKMGNETSASVGSVGMKWIRTFDAKNEQGLVRYLSKKNVRPLVGSPVLCVGARLGGEVRAFQSLPEVQLAIGVDFNPGEKNPLVMYGDAHSLQQFKNGTFGRCAYTAHAHVSASLTARLSPLASL